MASTKEDKARQAAFDMAQGAKVKLLQYLTLREPINACNHLAWHMNRLAVSTGSNVQQPLCTEIDLIALVFLADAKCTSALFSEARRLLSAPASDHSQAIEPMMFHLFEFSYYLRGFSAFFTLEYVSLYLDLCIKQQTRRRRLEKAYTSMPKNMYLYPNCEIYCIILCLQRQPHLWDSVRVKSRYTQEERLFALRPLITPAEIKPYPIGEDYAFTVESFAFILGDTNGFGPVKADERSNGADRSDMAEAYFKRERYFTGTEARLERRKREEVCLGCGAGRLEGDMKQYKKCSLCGVATYCSKACGVKHWKAGHKTECRRDEDASKTKA